MSDRGKAILFTLVVFLCGLSAGALLQNLTEHYWLHRGRHLPAPSWEPERASIIDKFRAELNLNDAQTEKLKTILDQAVRQYHDLHSFSEHVRGEGIKQIRDMLDPSQRARFDQILEPGKKAAEAQRQKRSR